MSKDIQKDDVNVVEGTEPMTIQGLLDWLGLLNPEGILLKPDGSPFSPLNDISIVWED